MEQKFIKQNFVWRRYNVAYKIGLVVNMNDFHRDERGSNCDNGDKNE